MKKVIKYFSVVDFKKYMTSIGYVSHDYNQFETVIERINNNDLCVISIGEPNEWLCVDNNIDLWANGVNNHWLPSTDAVLNIEFADSSDNGLKYKNEMTNEQAMEIIQHVLNNENKNTFIIHCSAGISRSGAVAAWLYDYFKNRDIDVIIEPSYPSTPNYYVKNKLKEIYNDNRQSN